MRKSRNHSVQERHVGAPGRKTRGTLRARCIVTLQGNPKKQTWERARSNRKSTLVGKPELHVVEIEGKDGVFEEGVADGGIEEAIGEMNGRSGEKKGGGLGEDAFAEGFGGGLRFQHVDAVIRVLEELFFC